MIITSENHIDYLFIRSAGRIKNEAALLRHAEMIYDEYKKYNHKKILLDALETQFPFELFPYYELVQFYIKKFPADIREIRLACLISPVFSEAGEFWEIVSNNRGFQYQAFTSVGEAEKWLLK